MSGGQECAGRLESLQVVSVYDFPFTAKAVIIRKASNAPGGRQELPADLKKVLSNRAPDQQLLASDILYVPESGVKRTLDMVLSAAISTSVYRVPY